MAVKSKKISRFSNSWHKSLYGPAYAQLSLDTPLKRKIAKDEVKFLIRCLNLQKGQTVLDIPCGTGRHVIALAKKGLFVTGIDINNNCLALARKNIKGLKTAKIRKGNMAQLSWAKGKFDAVFNLFTSFGYFKTERENKKVIREFARALRPGGRVVIQTINREWLLKFFTCFEWTENSKFFLVSRRKYNPKTKYMEALQFFFCKKSKKWEKSYHRIRLYSIPEIKTLLRGAGLKKIKVFDGVSGNKALRSRSSHPIYIAEAPLKKRRT